MDSECLSGVGRALATLCPLLRSAYRTRLLALSNLLLQPVSKMAAEGQEQPGHRTLLSGDRKELRPPDPAEVLKYAFCTGEGGRLCSTRRR
ncbi:MAG: hypothetical protein JO015_17955 [Verrucomicrobia bacterium]|nr:hypothetical protein [Verrucomicrobiota bacterium]